MDRVLAERGIGLVDGIALDIGVSSMQLDRADRGFSFQADGPLDMRMSEVGRDRRRIPQRRPTRPRSRASSGNMARSRAPARSPAPSSPPGRSSAPAELAAIVRRAAGFRPGQKSDPATRTFQAIRIHLNAELDELEQGLAAAERVAEARRPARRRHLPQPRGPDRQALPPRTQRRDASRFAPPPGCRCRPRTDLRAGRQAGRRRRSASWPRNPRARSARLRSAVRTAAPAWQTARRQCNERAQLPLGVHGRELRRRGARLLSGLAARRVRARRARGRRDQDRAGPARHPPAADRDRHARPARPARALERQGPGVVRAVAPTSSSRAASQLGRLAQPERKIDLEAPVVLASAPAPMRPAGASRGRSERDYGADEAAHPSLPASG